MQVVNQVRHPDNPSEDELPRILVQDSRGLSSVIEGAPCNVLFTRRGTY